MVDTGFYLIILPLWEWGETCKMNVLVLGEKAKIFRQSGTHICG
jgi:hypothetical protein